MNTIFDNIFTSFALFYGIGLIVFGLLYKFYPPKHISWFYGVQFKAAKRNQNSWQETHKFIPVPMMITGLILTVLSILPMLIENDFLFTFEAAIGLIIGAFFILYILTERHLKHIPCDSEMQNN